MSVSVGAGQCDLEPRTHALSLFNGAQGAPTGLKVGCKGGDE
jgi:hypothetical protein